jgi:hypothetical protein
MMADPSGMWPDWDDAWSTAKGVAGAAVHVGGRAVGGLNQVGGSVIHYARVAYGLTIDPLQALIADSGNCVLTILQGEMRGHNRHCLKAATMVRSLGKTVILKVVAAGTVIVGGVAVVASPFVYAACMRVTLGIDQIHCLMAAGFVLVAGLTAIGTGAAIWAEWEVSSAPNT